MWAGDQGGAGRQAARLASKARLGTSLQGARINQHNKKKKIYNQDELKSR